MLVVALTALACGTTARLPVSAGVGPTPELPAPRTSLIPTTKIATAIGWPVGTTPVGAPGIRVNAFASGLEQPRFVCTLPNGDVLVTEANAPPRPDEAKGIRGWFFKHFQRKAGGTAPSANRLSLLRDADGDGIAETRSVFIGGLNAPFGIVLAGQDLYVANSDAVLQYVYRDGATTVGSRGDTLVGLPAGTLNHHWTKTIVASPDGRTFYVSIGSNSNAAENGMAVEVDRATIWAIDAKSGAHRTFASGLRNAAGLAIEPSTGALWAAVNERDELGGDLVPDYMTAVHDGAFYGWTHSYFGRHIDTRVKPQRPDLVAKAVLPDYALGAHSASFRIVSSRGTTLPTVFNDGMFVGQHGSWNRNPLSGYKVSFVPFSNSIPSGEPIDLLTGFLTSENKAMGRPVGVAVDSRGALLVEDDVGNVVWRVSRRP